MLRNVDAPINDFEGQPLYADPTLGGVLRASAEMTSTQRETLVAAINKAGRTSLTLKSAMVNALQWMFDDERALDGEKKLERWKLAMKIHLGGDVELTSDEIVLVKQLVGKMYGPSVVGPVWTALEADKPKLAEAKAA